MDKDLGVQLALTAGFMWTKVGNKWIMCGLQKIGNRKLNEEYAIVVSNPDKFDAYCDLIDNYYVKDGKPVRRKSYAN